MGQSNPLFAYFVPFAKHYTDETVGFTRIRTLVVGLEEDMHADF